MEVKNIIPLSMMANKDVDIETILNIDRYPTDSPYKNIPLLYADGEVDVSILSEITVLEAAYFDSMLSDMTDEEREQFFNLYNDDKLPKIEHLEVNQKFKKYSELCKYLNEPHNYKGNQRKAQIKRFRRCFNWKKIPHSQEIVITEKYEYPKPPKLKNKQKAIFMRHIEYLLLAHLYSCSNHTATLSTQDMMVKFGMVKPEYIKLKREIYLSTNQSSYSQNNEKKDFVLESYKMAYQMIYRTLSNLENRRLIVYRKITVIDGIEATIEELDEIRKVELELLKQRELKDIRQIHMRPLAYQSKFYYERNRILKEEFGWQYVYEQYEIKSSHYDILYGIRQIYTAIAKDLGVLFSNRMTAELEKKQSCLEKEIQDYASLLDVSDDNELADAAYNLFSSDTTKERRTYLNNYGKMIKTYLPS